MLGFFESVVFKRKVKKYIDPNAGFSGVVGVAAVKAKGKATRQQQRRPGEWKPIESQEEEDPISSVLGDMELCEQRESASNAKNSQVEDDDDSGDREDEQDQADGGCGSPESDDESVGVDVMHQSVAEDEGSQISEDLSTFMINSVADKTKGKRQSFLSISSIVLMYINFLRN
jgi:hypothetical protein